MTANLSPNASAPADTIVAVATAAGGAARGIVRLSGPRVTDCLQHVFVSSDECDWQSASVASAFRGAFVVAHDLRMPGVLLFWPGERSYTREPVAELHTLGSPPLLGALVETLCREGARLAEPGEFTLRAFLTGRIDLTQAEAVLGVIDADDSHALHTALSQLAGGLAAPLQALRNDLIGLLAELEAGLDFVEEDIEFISRKELISRLKQSHHQVAKLGDQLSTRSGGVAERRVVLVGQPNAGKSSLFNALVECFGVEPPATEPALVSPVQGTTRDYLVRDIDCAGVHCQIVDTAGLDEQSSDDISQSAQHHMSEQRAQAALTLECVDATTGESERSATAGDLAVLTKIDLVTNYSHDQNQDRLATSSHTGVGLSKLAAAIADALRGHDTTAVPATAIRCRESVRLALAALDSAIHAAESDLGDEILAVEVHAALAEIGKMAGAVYTDDILDRIFSSFCIGK